MAGQPVHLAVIGIGGYGGRWRSDQHAEGQALQCAVGDDQQVADAAEMGQGRCNQCLMKFMQYLDTDARGVALRAELHLAADLAQVGLDVCGLGLERQELRALLGHHPEIGSVTGQGIGEHGFARLEQGADLVDRYRLEAGEFVVLGETAGEFGVDCLDRLAGGGDLVAQALFEGRVALLGGLAEGAGEVGFGPGTAGFGVLAVAHELGQFAVSLGEAGGHLGDGIGRAGGIDELRKLKRFVGDLLGSLVTWICSKQR